MLMMRSSVPVRRRQFMTIHKFAIADAVFERSPGQDGDIFTGNLLDQRHGGPVTIIPCTRFRTGFAGY